jgi:general secretion pathway protein A
MYEQFFGLTDLPFRLTPDPRYLFLSGKHAEALAHLRLGLTESSGFVCITGDVGTGKTTLLRSFLDGIEGGVSVAYIVDPGLSASDLLRRINREFGIPAEGTRAELIDALNAHLLARRTAGGICIVVVDEAQALAPDVLEQLRLLSNLETATEKLLKIVLVGQPQLRTLLLDPELAQLNQRLTLRWHMGPLAARETAAYVRHRLAIASTGRASALFTGPALWTLHHLAAGVPRLVNMLAHRALLVAYTRRRCRVDATVVLRAWREVATVPLPRRTSRRARFATALATLTLVGTVGVLGAPRMWHATASRTVPPAAAVDVAGGEDAAISSVETAPVGSVEDRVRATPASDTLRSAMNTVLRAWSAPILGDDEASTPDQLDAISGRRGLEHIVVTTDRRMLTAFDVPAILEITLPGEPPRDAAIVAIDDANVTLSIGGTTITADSAGFDRVWHGRAHFFWRDFEKLPRAVGTGASGPHVRRLQDLLRRAGAYDGPTTGTYDALTEDAVREFQRAHLLVGDGLVGRLTRMALYAASTGYERPTLAPARKAAS